MEEQIAPAPRAPRVLRLWMLPALVLGLAGAGLGFWIYDVHATEHDRLPPKLHPCFRILQKRLEKPSVVSPSEPFTLSDGETIYLTDTQNKAIGCAARLPGRADQDLARAWGIEDPDARARAMAELVEAVPPAAEHDKQALGLWRLTLGSLKAMPESAERDRAKQRIDQRLGCRFIHPALPECPTRPRPPLSAIALAGVGAAALLAAVLGLAVNVIRWIRWLRRG
jgi:hypothetical protein